MAFCVAVLNGATLVLRMYAANIKGVNVSAAQQRLTSATQQIAVATKGGKCAFAASASCQCVNGESRHSNSHGSGVCAAVRKAAVSPKSPMLRYARMADNEGQPKSFNNHFGFEQGFWKLKLGWFEIVPKRVFLEQA